MQEIDSYSQVLALVGKRERTESLDLVARFYFQDKLSKFCPTDHKRPNGFEREMFRYGVEYAVNKILQDMPPAFGTWLIKKKEELLYGN